MAEIAQKTEKTGLAGRTIQLVTDISLEEQLYLYERARRLKDKQICDKPGASPTSFNPEPRPLCEVGDAEVSEKVDMPDATVYLLFMEGSTRTKESFRNAAIYHNVKVNEFQAETSSFQKNETITDTMKMLSVYSTRRSVFIVRSPLEGVCSWLQTVLPRHAERFGIPPPAFVNAGDGRYTHPTAELIDSFSLLEQQKWDRSFIHVALVGDLAHVRTAHSKVDGLNVFRKVKVDLVAPEVFEYPVEYRNKMRENGFELREFSSVEEYFNQASDSLASIWCFYQPQFQRCGDMPQELVGSLRGKVSFRHEWQSRLPEGAVFFQTLPRNKEHPIIPLSLDGTSLNGWDRVANNAYFVHVVLLSTLFGKVGPQSLTSEEDAPEVQEKRSPLPFSDAAKSSPLPEFIEAVDLSSAERIRRPERATSGGSMPLQDGMVIDHICVSVDAAYCWRRLRMVRTILGWSKHIGSEGVYHSKRGEGQKKGLMSFPNFSFETLTVPQMKVLASIAPGCTVNAIKGSKVFAKYRLHVPERIYNLPNIRCKNGPCVSHPQNKQRDVVAYFERVPFYETSALPGCKAGEYLLVCKYCRWPHRYEDIWADDAMRYNALSI